MIRPLFVITEAFMRIQSTLTEHFFEDGKKTHITTKRVCRDSRWRQAKTYNQLIHRGLDFCSLTKMHGIIWCSRLKSAKWELRPTHRLRIFIAGTGFDGKSITKSGDYLVRNKELHTKSFLDRKSKQIFRHFLMCWNLMNDGPETRNWQSHALNAFKWISMLNTAKVKATSNVI